MPPRLTVAFPVLLAAVLLPKTFAQNLTEDPLQNLPDAAPGLIRSGDTIAIIGGTFVDRMRLSGTFEAVLQSAAAERQVRNLRFRNLGWSGDDAVTTHVKCSVNPGMGLRLCCRNSI